MVLKRPVLLSFPHPHWYRHLRHAVCLGCCSKWNYMLCGCCSRSVFPFPSLLSASARKRNNTIVGTQNCRLLQPVNRCCSHCNEIQGFCLAQSLVLKIAGRLFQPAVQTNFKPCCGAVPAGTSCIFECWAATTYTITDAPFARARRRREILVTKCCLSEKRVLTKAAGGRCPEMLLNSLAVVQLGCCSRLFLAVAAG